MEGALPKLQSVIDKLGFRYAQLRIILLAGGLWLADGSELLVINVVSKTVSKEWDLTVTERGSITSSVFFGMFLGSMMSGEVGDVYGRRLPVILSYAGIAVLSVLSVYATGIYSLLFFRSLIGVAMGYGQPSGYAFALEVTPTDFRVLTCCSIIFFFTLGAIFGAGLVYADDASMKNMHWRWMVMMGAIPSVLLGSLAAAFLQESPFYLSGCGRKVEALEVLAAMRKENGLSESESIDFQKPPQVQHEPSRYDVILGPSLLRTTVICCYTCFTVNMCGHGALYAFSQLLPELKSSVSPAGRLLMGLFAEIPGMVFACLVMQYLTRKTGIHMALTGIVLSTSLFLYAAEQSQDCAFCDGLMQVCFCGLRLFSSAGFAVTYCYINEVFPTKARATGNGVCFGAGRVAALVAPFVYEWLTSWTEHSMAFIYFLVFVSGMCLILSCFLEIETAGMALKEAEDEIEPLKA